jgi:hypothetical protein
MLLILVIEHVYFPKKTIALEICYITFLWRHCNFHAIINEYTPTVYCLIGKHKRPRHCRGSRYHNDTVVTSVRVTYLSLTNNNNEGINCAWQQRTHNVTYVFCIPKNTEKCYREGAFYVFIFSRSAYRSSGPTQIKYYPLTIFQCWVLHPIRVWKYRFTFGSLYIYMHVRQSLHGTYIRQPGVTVTGLGPGLNVEWDHGRCIIHFMYIDCTYILFKKYKTTHRKLMSSWPKWRPWRLSLPWKTHGQEFRQGSTFLWCVLWVQCTLKCCMWT